MKNNFEYRLYNHQPSVTIGIPVFNAEKSIKSSIESALNQDYRNIIIQIHDNFSTDSSYAICKQMAELYSNIRLKKHSKNIGSTLNFQSIVYECRTEFLCFLGADDTISSNWVSEQIKHPDSKDFIGLGQFQLIYCFGGDDKRVEMLRPFNFTSFSSIVRRISFIYSPIKVPRMILLWGIFSTDRSSHFDHLFAGQPNGSFSDVLWSYDMLKNYKTRTIGCGIYYKKYHIESESYKLLKTKKKIFISRIINRGLSIIFPSHFFALAKRSSILELFFIIVLFPLFLMQSIFNFFSKN